MSTVTGDDIREFNAYLHACTKSQVLGVLEKETRAGRDAYAALADHEARARGLHVEAHEVKMRIAREG